MNYYLYRIPIHWLRPRIVNSKMVYYKNPGDSPCGSKV